MKDNDKTITAPQEVADTRRDFIAKFGKLAVITPIAVTALMTPKTSKAMSSDGAPGVI
ncbi:hypothetical protein RI844_11630 [Thalassotalea fonticola]|uniref:Uncharacterized protein n=1 Tax=Thalassotalea fonticola TaxID=3065649 RepID=A0ABZ0GKV7_9GAMM|nr:hypothetical protein RI844_11630 [Colwelliaceae bacterium S1-1]